MEKLKIDTDKATKDLEQEAPIYTHVYRDSLKKIRAARYSFDKSDPTGFVVGLDLNDRLLFNDADAIEIIKLVEKKIKEKLESKG